MEDPCWSRRPRAAGLGRGRLGRDAELRERAREVLEARVRARHSKSPRPARPDARLVWVGSAGGPVFKTSDFISGVPTSGRSRRRGRVSGAALLGARGGMPSIWRPNVRVTLDEDGEVEDTERGRGGDEEGHEAERAPRTKGPCEHGVKYRSNCKVCSACPHGSGANSARSAVVLNLRARSSALSVQGVRWVSICEHGRQRSHARSAGSQSASTVASALCARSAGVSICEHGRYAQV